MAFVQENRWEARPRLAAALKIAIYGAPVIAGVVTTITVTRWMQVQRPSAPGWAVFLSTLPVTMLVVVAGERILRRLLPLALLLRLSLLFPDQLPNRFGTALRAASPKRLIKQLNDPDHEQSTVAEHILGLAAALNAHDRRTRGHSERVRAVTMLLADQLGVTGADRDRLEWAALLHDLGKLTVSPEILNKKGRPSDREWRVLSKHPAAGPALAGDLTPWLGEWVHAMDQHHEKFDGSGYPLGLTGDEIALSGRIVAVSDAFEVMTATRSYKKPMSTEAARTELVKCAGTHFDPQVTRCFMQLSIGEIHQALGPSSWLASLPFSSLTTKLAVAGNIVVGGSLSPGFAAAAAMTVVASTGAGFTSDVSVTSHPIAVEGSAQPTTPTTSEIPDQPTDTHPAGDSPESPGDGGIDDELPIDDLPIDDLPIDDIINDLPIEDIIGDLPIDDIIGDLPIDDIIDDLPIDDIIGDLPIDDIIDDLPVIDGTTVNDLLPEDLPVEDLLPEDLPVEDIGTDSPVDPPPVPPLIETPTDLFG